MFGFLFGIACLGGLYMYLTREERGGRRLHRRRQRRMRRFGLRWLYDELDTSSNQEHVIEDALRELQREAEEMRGQLRTGRFELARAFREADLDPEALDKLSAPQQAALERLRTRAKRALTEVHAALDPRQRSLLADLLNEGPRHGGHRGCLGGLSRSWS